MKLTKEEVKHVAKLANLPLTEEELSNYSEQLSKILEYIDQLGELNTDNITPTYNVTGLSSVWEEDTFKTSLSQEDALANAKESKNGSFVTKGVFEE